MPVSHLHRDIEGKSYFSGVLTAVADRYRLTRDFLGQFGVQASTGWVDMDPHYVDVAVDGNPVARIESHHNREDVDVYTDHPKAAIFEEEAKRRGYRPVD